MPDQNAAGKHRECRKAILRADQPPLETATQKEVDADEHGGASQHPTEEGDAALEAEACRRVLDVVIDSLKQRRAAEAQQHRNDAVIEQEIGEGQVNLHFFAVQVQNAERRQDAQRDHDAVHMHFPKQRVR